jgi:hypothetical protein
MEGAKGSHGHVDMSVWRMILVSINEKRQPMHVSH